MRHLSQDLTEIQVYKLIYWPGDCIQKAMWFLCSFLGKLYGLLMIATSFSTLSFGQQTCTECPWCVSHCGSCWEDKIISVFKGCLVYWLHNNWYVVNFVVLVECTLKSSTDVWVLSTSLFLCVVENLYSQAVHIPHITLDPRFCRPDERLKDLWTCPISALGQMTCSLSFSISSLDLGFLLSSLFLPSLKIWVLDWEVGCREGQNNVSLSFINSFRLTPSPCPALLLFLS